MNAPVFIRISVLISCYIDTAKYNYSAHKNVAGSQAQKVFAFQMPTMMLNHVYYNTGDIPYISEMSLELDIFRNNSMSGINFSTVI